MRTSSSKQRCKKIWKNKRECVPPHPTNTATRASQAFCRFSWRVRDNWIRPPAPSRCGSGRALWACARASAQESRVRAVKNSQKSVPLYIYSIKSLS